MNRPDDRLRAELRQAADAYVPDRAVIARRAATRRAAAARRDRMRPALAALAVAAVAAGGATFAQLRGEPSQPAPAPIAAGRPSSAASAPSTRPASPAPSKPAPRTSTPGQPGAPAEPGAPAGPDTPAPERPTGAAVPDLVEVNGVVDKASVATWTQNTVTLRIDEPTWVEVTVRVARSKDAKRAGWFTTVPHADITFTARDTEDALLYTYAVKEGARLRPGTYVFAAQFSHGSGRGPGADTFEVDARAGGADATERGNFTRT